MVVFNCNTTPINSIPLEPTMSYTAPDFSDDVIALLSGEGYALSEGKETDGDELAGKFWFTWAVPGMADCEVGETCDSETAAWYSAVKHRFENSAIEMDCVGDLFGAAVGEASAGKFVFEEPDIVRLAADGADADDANEDESPAGADPLSPAARGRSGWVNVGAHSVRIRVDDDGDLQVEAFASGNERDALGSFVVPRAAAMTAGARDNDA